MAVVLFEKIASLLGKKVDPEVEKRNLLKLVRKDILQSDYHKFFKPRTLELEPPIARFFHELYKPLAQSQTQILMQNMAKSTRLKQLIIEYFMDANLIAMQKRLSLASMEERARTTSVKDLAAQVQEELDNFTAAFTNSRISLIDNCYNGLLAFSQFVTFDFFHILKKFDPNFTAQNPNYQPKFNRISAEFVLEALKDFLEIAYPLDKREDWPTLFKILKNFKNDVEVIDPKQWARMLVTLHAVQQSSIMVLIIRCTEENPVWQSNPNFPQEHIVKPYLDGIQAEVSDYIDKLVNAKRYAQIEELAMSIFGSLTIERLKYYTAKNSEVYEKKNLGSFLHVTELNYLKIFLLDYYKRDIRELCDLLLIRGQWTKQGIFKPLSDAFQEVMSISDKLLAFDETLSENGDAGGRLKNYLLTAERDKSKARSLALVLNTVNEEALTLSTAAAKSLVVIATELKSLYGDYDKNPHELIINWKEIESVSEIPITTRISQTYKKIHNFVTMMYLLINSEEQ